MEQKKIIILGSTGSIGTQTLDLVRENPARFHVVALTCRRSVDLLLEQIEEFKPEAVAVYGEEERARVLSHYPKLTVLTGEDGLVEIASMEADLVLNALMGISGLAPTERALRTGKDLALANKETLVTGGALITKLALDNGLKILPVDSEHSAIFQCLEGNAHRRVKRILLTASGGPFRGYSLEELEKVTLKQALDHPNWSMGSKITIDSATMMNKGLEVIEAKWLFDLSPDQIDIAVHPESIIHSMVEYEDTSVLAQLGLPDMRIPIGLALAYPERLPYAGKSLDLFEVGSLHFERPNPEVFDCINLAYEALREGKSYAAFLNGANEELVALFLQDRIPFLAIQRTLRALMEEYRPVNVHTVDEILAVDREARVRVKERVLE